MKQLLTPKVRTYIYGVIVTLVPLLVAIDIFTAEIAGHVLNITAALLSVGGSALALANVPKD
jgi:hypothetical protein